MLADPRPHSCREQEVVNVEGDFCGLWETGDEGLQLRRGNTFLLAYFGELSS